jgi:hypothetical protein
MLGDWKVMNNNAAAQNLKHVQEYAEQLSLLGSI